MNKIWIIIGGWDYEGYSEPLAAFHDEATAAKYLEEIYARIQHISRYHTLEVMAIPIGAADPSDLGGP